MIRSSELNHMRLNAALGACLLLLSIGTGGRLEAARPAPTAITINSVTINPTPATVTPTVVNFSVSATATQGALTYQWDFGDATPPVAFSSNNTTTHLYNKPGHYNVRVNVH